MSALVIYTIGSRTHGLGHVKRCLTLACELGRRGVGVIFATEHETEGVGLLRRAGFTCYEYHPLDVSWAQLGAQYHHLLIDVEGDPSEMMIDAARPWFKTITVVSGAGYAPNLATAPALPQYAGKGEEADHA